MTGIFNITHTDHTHIVSEGEAESILLAKCGYGIALLPEFLVALQAGIACIPIADTKNIEHGIYNDAIPMI